MGLSFTLFLKECKIICKSVIYIAFICAAVLFYNSQMGDEITNDISQYYTNEDYYTGSLLHNPLIKPQEGAESYGTKYDEIPEQIMPETVASLILAWKQNYYITYPVIFRQEIKLTDKKQAEIAQNIEDITGISSEELYNIVFEERVRYVDDSGILHSENISYADIIPIKVTYEEFKEKMKRVDKIIGGGSDYSVNSLNKFSHSQVPVTYEEKSAEYDAFINEDKITGAYAKLFCDYMGIVAGMLSVFVPAAFLMRDKRARASELIFSRDISSLKFILVRYIALVFMMLIPFLLLSILPSIQLIEFAVKNSLPVDIFGFAKYITAWLLPTLMTTTAVAFILMTVTDTPIAIAVQFLWGFLSLMFGSFSAAASGTGELIDYSSLIIRHNSAGHLQIYKDGLTQLTVNRISYAILSIALIALTIFIYEQKRRGEADVRGSLRKIFRNRKSAD